MIGSGWRRSASASARFITAWAGCLFIHHLPHGGLSPNAQPGHWRTDPLFLNLRSSEIHLFYNLGDFYWHFLEILWLSFFPEIRNLTTFTRLMDYNNGFSISSFFLSLLSCLWIGAQFPQEKFLSYGRILTLDFHFLIMCILLSQKAQRFGGDNKIYVKLEN